MTTAAVDKPIIDSLVVDTEVVDKQMVNKQAADWQASLALSFESSTDRTIMRREHNGPLLVQRPFYPEEKVCHTVLLHPPAGIVGGDDLTIKVDCHQDAAALVTTPGASRFYGSDGRTARQTLNINVDGGSMEWLPMETIYFDECEAVQTTCVHLNNNSRYIGWEISCFGRTAGNFPYGSGKSTIQLDINLEGTPLLHERLKVEGAADINRSSGLRGATVSATMVAIAPGFDAQHWVVLLREVLPPDEFALTDLDNLLVVRYLGQSSESAKNGFLNAWKIVRPQALQRPACTPRIWAT